MNKTLSSRHKANKQVSITLKSNEDKFSGIPVFKNVVGELNSQVENTNNLLIQVEAIPSQTSGNKKVARTELIAITLKVSNVAKVYAYMKKDENLGNFLICSESALASKMRQQELLSYSKSLDKKIMPILSELAEYGVTEELKSELTKEISEFEILLTEPRQLISERKTTNELIEEQIDKTYKLLINQLDPLMELFIDDKEFYLAYKSARMIVDPAKRKKVEEENV